MLTAIAALLGFFHGYLNGAAMGQPVVGSIALLGLVAAVFVLVTLAAAFVVRLRWQWTRIAVRVAGSWIAASGLLMLGWLCEEDKTWSLAGPLWAFTSRSWLLG
jgi:urease accessory protein